MIQYDICIPFVGPHQMILACLRSVRRHSDNYRVIVYANGAPEELTKRVLSEGFSSWKYLKVSEVQPIIVPHNRMLEESKAPYVVILNDDTEVPHNWLPNLRRWFDKIPNLAIAAPCLTDTAAPNDAVKLGAPKEGVWLDAPFVDTQCVMLSRETINRLGHFNSDFHYRWDTDYALRAKREGMGIAVDLETVVVHKRGGTSAQHDPDIVRKATADVALLRERYPEYDGWHLRCV